MIILFQKFEAGSIVVPMEQTKNAVLSLFNSAIFPPFFTGNALFFISL